MRTFTYIGLSAAAALLLAGCATTTEPTAAPSEAAPAVAETVAPVEEANPVDSLITELQASWDTDNPANKKTVCGLWADDRAATLEALLGTSDATPMGATNSEVAAAVGGFFDANCAALDS